MRNDIENGLYLGADDEWERQNGDRAKEPVRTFQFIDGKLVIREVEEC